MKKNIPLLLIFIVVFVDLLGFGLLIPILPTFATKELHISESAIGITIAVYSLVQFLFNPVFGSLSDKYGRRKIILYTLLLNATGYIIFSFSHTYLMLILSRVVAGIGGSSIGVAQAYIADVTTNEERSKGMGLIGVAFSLGFLFGPILGGILSHFGYMVVGLVSASFSILAFILSVFFLPESLSTNNQIIKRKIFDIKSFYRVIKLPSLGLLIILFFILTFSVANIYGTFALLGYKLYQMTDMQIGFVFGFMGLVSAIVQGGLIGRLSKHFSDNTLISLGAFFTMVGLALIPYAGSINLLYFVCVILNLGTAILQPTLLGLISKVSLKNEQGMVLGTNQSLSAFARMLGPLWGGFSFQYLGYQIPFLTGAVFTFVLFIFSVFYFSKHIKYEKA